LRKFLIATVILAAAGTSSANAGDQRNCQLIELSSVGMTLDDDGRPVITASLSGEDVPMLVDTGGAFSMVSRATVDKLKLTPQHLPQNMFFMESTAEDIKSMAYGHPLKIGKLSADKYPFLILPYGWDDPQTGGLIGSDILSNYDIEFDFAAMKMHIMSPDHCAGQGVYWTKQPYMALPIRLDENGQIHFDAMVDGKQMDALLDTGSSNTRMRLDVARSILGWSSNPAELKCSDDGEYCRYPFKSLGFGGVAVGNPEIYIVPDKMAALHEQNELHEHQGRAQASALLIGTTVMRKLHMYIAYKEHMIYATGADAH
jgi:predicted aspartyl protease